MTEPERQDAVVRPETAKARAEVSTPTVTITAVLWITWAQIAVEHEREALKARQDAQEQTDAGLKAEDVARETSHALLTICSSAFAMEALAMSLAERVIGPDTLAKWKTSRRTTKVESRAREVLKNSIKSAKTANDLADRWRGVFEQRNKVVHYLEYASTPTDHPSGIGKVAEVYVIYGLENATKAVDLLLETLEAIEADPKPKVGDLRGAAASWLDILRGNRRAQT